MKIKGNILLAVVLVAVVMLGANLPSIDLSEKESILMRTILNVSDLYHFDPQDIDDGFSEKVYASYLDRIDRGRRWLTQQDLAQLEAFRVKLDDEAQDGTYKFFDLSTTLLAAGREKTQTYYRDLLSVPMDFSAKGSIEFDEEKKSFAKDDAELEEYWEKQMKYEVLTRLIDKLDEEPEEDEEQKTEAELEAEVRKSVLKIYDDWYDRMDKLRRSDRLSTYINSITNIFDPHTGYFEPIEKQNFDINFKGRLEGIGARLRTDGDFTKVISIVVGGPAWKGEELQDGDLIMKVAQGDEEEHTDIKGMRVDDVVQLIRGDKGTKVRLTVKREDGSIQEVSIIRDIVVFEERFAKSLLLEDAENKHKIGYIDLPGFYADFQDRDGRFCGADIEKEISKLKTDNIDGIILDLRNNPGGSLQEVVKMSGLFIEEGPVVQVKSRNRRPDVLSDVDPKVQYDGPLIVLVNNFSASASEILAAALQDYNRAIIVGSRSTFGKGTVQRFIDLDRALRGNTEIKPLGQIKLTMQKYYRVDGGSVQLKGVESDIVLPDNFAFSETGERDYENALDWSEIEPADNYTQNVYQVKKKDEIRRRSKARIASNETFQKVLKNAKRLEKRRELTEYPIQREAYVTLEEAQEAEATQFKKLFDNKVLEGAVSNLSTDLPTLANAEEGKKERNKNFIESIEKDIYVLEALHIMNDMIRLQ